MTQPATLDHSGRPLAVSPSAKAAAGGREIIRQLWRQAGIWWQQRQPREQKILMAGSAIAAVIILILAVEGGYTGYRQLQRSLPTLAQQAMLSDYYAEQLAGQPADAANSAQSGNTDGLTAAVTESLKRYSTGTRAAEIYGAPQTTEFAGRAAVRIEINRAPGGEIIAWLDDLSARYRVEIAALNLHHDTANEYSGTLTLAFRKP